MWLLGAEGGRQLDNVGEKLTIVRYYYCYYFRGFRALSAVSLGFVIQFQSGGH